MLKAMHHRLVIALSLLLSKFFYAKPIYSRQIHFGFITYPIWHRAPSRF